MGVA
jgi:hypothetical protein